MREEEASQRMDHTLKISRISLPFFPFEQCRVEQSENIVRHTAHKSFLQYPSLKIVRRCPVYDTLSTMHLEESIWNESDGSQ